MLRAFQDDDTEVASFYETGKHLQMQGSHKFSNAMSAKRILA